LLLQKILATRPAWVHQKNQPTQLFGATAGADQPFSGIEQHQLAAKEESFISKKRFAEESEKTNA